MKTFLSLLILIVSGVTATQAQDTWGERLRTAAESGSRSDVAELVAQDRLGVSDVLKDILDDALTASDTALMDAAGRVADAYAARFGETAHQTRVAFVRSLDASGVQTKLTADSLYAEAYARRGSADTREEARELYASALALYEQIGDTAGQAEANGQLGYVSWWLDRDAYLSYNQRALALRRELGDLKLVGNSLNDVGIYYFGIARDNESALKAFLEAEEVRWSIGDSTVLARMLPVIGQAYEGTGDFENASEYYKKASSLYLAVGDTAKFITQRNNAAGLLTDYMERHSDALVDMLELREELRAFDYPRAEALVTNSLGIVSRRLGDYASAIAYYQEVIQISEENGFDDLLAGAYNNIGVVYTWIGRPDRAVSFFERSLGQSQIEGVPEGIRNAHINLGNAHFELKDFDESLEHFRQARVTAAELGDSLWLGTIHTGFGNTLLRAGSPEKAAVEYQQALEIANAFDLADMLMGVQFGMGDVAEHLGKPNEALDWYMQAANTLESSRGMLRASEDKAGYLARSRYLFEDVIDFLSRQAVETGAASWTEEAFNFSEQAKARAFVDQLAEALANVQQGVDPVLLEDQAVLTDNLIYLRDELAAAPDKEARNALRAQIREQEIEFDRVERDLRERNPAYAALRYPDPVDLSTLQASLADDDLVLAYSVGDSSSTLWSITAGRATVHLLPVRSEIKDRVDVLRYALQDPSRSTSAQYADAAGGLFDVIAGPARSDIEQAGNVIIIPDDVLHYVPFEALVMAPGDSYSDLSYLVNAAPVSYVQSASVLVQLQQRPAIVPTKELLAIGDPDFGGTNELSALRGNALQQLPFSGEEVSAISGLFESSSVDLYTGDSATEMAIRDDIASNTYRFVHFATHGLINDDRPDFSALALARGNSRGEGLLQASEIFNLPFSAELVVLSACETGLGQLVQGEGMVGLTRAFMYAGAGAIVASLWSVADASTAELMQYMYSDVVNNKASAADALRSSKLSLIRNPETAHPFHWAPFVFFGDSK